MEEIVYVSSIKDMEDAKQRVVRTPLVLIMSKHKIAGNIISLNLYNGYINTLRKAQENNTLAVFVGAGFSIATDEKLYKPWSALIDVLQKELGIEDKTEYLKVAQLYELEHGRLKIKSILQSQFPDNDIPGELQGLLVSLKPHYIVTTNWDCLIDNEIHKNGEKYDIIVNDQELVEKQRSNKLIKMHGDFYHDNFVFTEDDYLNYSERFPLIENFIKSILSTHTILFLGYSFSDIDLKQIVNWIQKHSVYRPPAFRVIRNGEYNHSEEKYLDKFGIKVLPLSDADGFDKDLQGLLRKIKDNTPPTPFDASEYILSRLQPLDCQSVILTDQIVNQLTNCIITHDKFSRSILEFTIDYFTWDKDHEKLRIYQNFINELNKSEDTLSNSKIAEIKSILFKADIHGVMITSLLSDKPRYQNFDGNQNIPPYDNDEKSLDFDFSIIDCKETDIISRLLNIYNLFSIELYEEAYEQCKQLIKYLHKCKHTNLLFIAYLNYNTILRTLKININKENKYKDDKEINIEKEYRSLLNKEQNECREIFDFCSFSYLYRKSFYVRQDLIKIKEQIRSIENGGFTFSSDGTSYFAEHKNLIDYVVSNGILIESFVEFQVINKTFVEIALNRKMQSSEIDLNKYEIFSCIKYFKNDELLSLFNIHFNNEIKPKKLKLSDKIITWLIDDSLHNCIKNYINKKIVSSSNDIYISNILSILSFVEVLDNNKANILKEIKLLLNNARNTLGLFEAINNFFGRQYNLFKPKFLEEDIFAIIETLLKKYIDGQVNGYEYAAITQNKLSNLFGYIYILEFKFTNITLLDAFLSKVKLNNEEIHDLTYIAQYILLAIYFAADEECKSKIKDFIFYVKEIKNNDTEGNLIFLLTLLQVKIHDDYKGVAEQLETHLQQQKEKNLFSSRLFSMQKQVEDINKEHCEFKQSLNLINELIERYNSNKLPSYI